MTAGKLLLYLDIDMGGCVIGAVQGPKLHEAYASRTFERFKVQS